MIQPRYSWPLAALIHWEVKVGGKSMKDVGGAGGAGFCCDNEGSETEVTVTIIFFTRNS